MKIPGEETILVHRRHRELMRSLYGEYDATVIKHGYPIIVDKESLYSVLRAPGPTEWRSVHTRESTAHVTVLDMQWYDLREAPKEDEYQPEDEIGWTNILAVKVHPRLDSMLQSGLWPQVVYCTPPEISRPKLAAFSGYCLGQLHNNASISMKSSFGSKMTMRAFNARPLLALPRKRPFVNPYKNEDLLFKNNELSFAKSFYYSNSISTLNRKMQGAGRTLSDLESTEA